MRGIGKKKGGSSTDVPKPPSQGTEAKSVSDKRVKEVRVGNPRRDATCQTQSISLHILLPDESLSREKPVPRKPKEGRMVLGHTCSIGFTRTGKRGIASARMPRGWEKNMKNPPWA